MTSKDVLGSSEWEDAEVLMDEVRSGRLGAGGGKSPKLERGENFEFPGAPETNPCRQRFKRKLPLWGSKVQVFEGQLSCRVPPPSSIWYVLKPPPLAVSEGGISHFLFCIFFFIVLRNEGFVFSAFLPFLRLGKYQQCATWGRCQYSEHSRRLRFRGLCGGS